MHDPVKNTVDALSVATALGTVMEWLPAIAAIFTIVWTGIRIYETPTVQGWLGKSVKEKQDEN
jgi:hypothetical protein